jgi:uncharacterized protein (DUF4415 family)
MPRNVKKVSSLKASGKSVTVSRSKRSYGKPSIEHPEADVKHIVKGIVRHGLKPIAPKLSISLRVDADVLEWFKSQGEGYQTRMNSVLRAFRDASV